MAATTVATVFGGMSILVLVPVVIVGWGKHWQGCTVPCKSDNMAVVATLNTGSAKDHTGC